LFSYANWKLSIIRILLFFKKVYAIQKIISEKACGKRLRACLRYQKLKYYDFGLEAENTAILSVRIISPFIKFY